MEKSTNEMMPNDTGNVTTDCGRSDIRVVRIMSLLMGLLLGAILVAVSLILIGVPLFFLIEGYINWVLKRFNKRW